MASSEIAHIFWTGGWDSTFRVLDLLLVKKRVVQPYYIMMARGRDRISFSTEIRTINTIKQLIFQKAPECKDQILPTIFRDASDVRPNAEITAKRDRLNKLSFMSGQYELCARFADELQRDDLQLSIHRDDRAHRFLENTVVQETDGNDTYYRLQDEPSNPDLRIFKYFRFPLFDLTKVDMEQAAARHGFAEIMEHTWFCFRPFMNGSPCGTCPACRYTRREGLSRRIGKLGQIRYYMAYPLRFAASIGKPEIDRKT